MSEEGSEKYTQNVKQNGTKKGMRRGNLKRRTDSSLSKNGSRLREAWTGEVRMVSLLS